MARTPETMDETPGRVDRTPETVDRMLETMARTLDVRGEICPYPMMRTVTALKKLPGTRGRWRWSPTTHRVWRRFRHRPPAWGSGPTSKRSARPSGAS